jgi:hypothetical protein
VTRFKDSINEKGRKEQSREQEKEKLTIQAEAARTRGTPLTPSGFQAWRQRFTLELKQKRDKEEEERIKALPPREREDFRKRRERLSGESGSRSFYVSHNLYHAILGLTDYHTPYPLSSLETSIILGTRWSEWFLHFFTLCLTLIPQFYCPSPNLLFHPTSRDSKPRKLIPGRQLFETTKIIDDEKYYEEGSTEIDLSKYTREEREKERRKEEEEEEKRRVGILADEGD